MQSDFPQAGFPLQALDRLTRYLPRSPASCCITLVGVTLVAFIVAAYYSYSRSQALGVAAAAVAAGVCCLASTAALVVSYMFRGPSAAVPGVFIGMFLRTGVPLFVGFVVTNLSSRLASAGVMGQFLVFYLLTLSVETLLSVRLLTSIQNSPQTK